eukprot:gene4118-4674_t
MNFLMNPEFHLFLCLVDSPAKIRPKEEPEEETTVFGNSDNSRASSPKEASSSKDLYVPKKTEKEKGPKIQEVLEQAVKAFNKAVEQDISKDILHFMKEENEHDRQHDREMMRMQMDMFSSFL